MKNGAGVFHRFHPSTKCLAAYQDDLFGGVAALGLSWGDDPICQYFSKGLKAPTSNALNSGLGIIWNYFSLIWPECCIPQLPLNDYS